ncbi:hypothetical protein BBO99_00005399 [Phytophthora kernoviae]|uniref:non-specific serine/threonine protein kinase n=1 Tax=Phytophthora kernoviae TaxID=325452 RepID=A0A3R7MTH5_9STRA|nr:hypothetical protein BBI17_006238 [Phytophthora kernoviae]RLN79250.1 hypothetical protein BBO99_00005399 [Phytophthora kernoviae]
MGNAAPRAQPQSVLDSASQYRTFLMDYTPRSMDMMFGSLIGDGKFLKSISCKCDEGHLVVKIYRKYDEKESLTSAEMALRQLALAFSVEQQPNVIPYADFQLSNKYNVAFMVRQYFASNLYDRICSRPFLTMVEKKWIAFQILRALEQSHAKEICHGDIKQENVMVTSWNWVFLTDFAPFKPTYIPEDDPADYNYYFCAIDATRRGCSVAPERFYGKGSVSISSATDSEVTVEEVDKQILAMGMNSSSMAAGNPMHAPPSAPSNGSAPSSYSRSRREGSLLESMDIFSAGCVIAELFLGGKPLFDLPSLLKYRTGNSDALRQTLKKVGDPRLEEMLLHMLQLDPSARLSASGYLTKYTSPSDLFPTYFDNFLFRFLVLVLSRGGKVPDARIRLVCKYYGRLVREVAGVEDPEGEEFFKLRLKEGYGSDRLATATEDQQTHVAQRVLEELEQRIPTKHDRQRAERENAPLTKLQRIKEKENDMRGLSGTLQKKKIEKLHDQFNALTQKKKNSLLLDYARESSTGRMDGTDVSSDADTKEEEDADEITSDSTKSRTATPPPHTSKTRRMKPPTYPGSEPWSQDRNGIVIILSLICSSLRHVQVPESKLTALYLIRSLGQFTSDEARLQRLIPYLLEVIDDPSATSDPDELVRITFAECLPQLAETSRRFLEIAHAMKQKTVTSSASSSSLATMSNRGNDSSNTNAMYMASSSFDKDLSVLHKMISRFVIQLTTPDQKASSSLVKRALLVDITRLCVFFGRERTLDVVLPQLITFLNDPDWELRGAFFDYIVGVCSFVGRVAVEHNILPCIEQALFDVQEIVITKAVECLTGLCQLGLFQKKISTLVEKARMTCSLLLHPSWWIRDAVLKLMSQISGQMGSVDANVFLSPLIRPFLRKTMMFLPDEDEAEVTRRLRDCCRLHVSPVASSAAVTAETISNSVESGLSSVYDQRKNEIQSLKLMQQYVSIASMQMRSKLEMAKTEQAARMQGPSKSDRTGSPHGSVANSTVSASPNASVGITNPFARKLSRSHLRVLFVPDMRFALSTAVPLKASNFGIQVSTSAASSAAPVSNPMSNLSASTALVTRSRSHAPNTSPSHRGGTAVASNPSNGGASIGVPSLESLSLSHVGKMYSLVEPSAPVSTSPITVTGPSSVVPSGSVSSSLDDSGLSVHGGQMDSNHFAPTSGGVMVSMLNMNMRDMYGGEGMSSLLDPHHHPVHASPVSPPRQRMIKKAHTTYHHYFAFKESAMDPALGNPRKLLARLNALAQDYSFLASASNDGTVKIWSVRSLQHSVNQGSRFASASSNGTVHVFRVDKVSASGGNVQASGLKELRTNNSAVMGIDYLNNVTESLLLYATRDGKIHAWDLRMRREAWTLTISPELGYVTCMTHSLDVSWFAVGTSRGFLCLWDLRFLVLIRIWRHSSHRAIHRLQPCLGLPNTLPLDETSVPLVFVAAGDGEVAVFDLSIGACRAVFRTLEAQASEAEACKCPTLLHVPIPHRSRSVLGSFLGIYGIATALDEISTSPLSEEPSVRAILCPSLHIRGIGDALITGGEDRQLRYWDIRNGKQSYTVCGNGEAKSFYDNQAAPNDWWRMNPSSSSSVAAPQRFGEMPAAPIATTAAVTKPEMAWSKLSPPLITVCQDSSCYSTPGGVAGAAASGSGGVESAISMERRGLVPPSPAHTDCILDLTLVELGGNLNPSPMLVSCGRDALIKVWK